MEQPVPPLQQEQPPQQPQQLAPFMHALWGPLVALNPKLCAHIGVAVGLAVAAQHAVGSYLVSFGLFAFFAWAASSIHMYFYSFAATAVVLILWGYGAEIIFSLSEDLWVVGISAAFLTAVAISTFLLLGGVYWAHAKIRGHNNREVPKRVWVIVAVLCCIAGMSFCYFSWVPNSTMLWKVQCASRLPDPSRYSPCSPKFQLKWCSSRPSLTEIRARYKELTKSIVGQVQQLEYYTTLVLGYFSELHRGDRTMTGPNEPLTILSAGLHGLGKNYLNWATAVAFNRIDECNALLYPPVGYVGPNYAQCVRMHGVLQLSGEVLKMAAAKEGMCHIIYEEIAAWLQDTVRCGYIPILNLEEVQLYPNMGQCLIPLINGDQISVAGYPPFTMANSLILMTANIEVPILAQAQEVIVKRAGENQRPVGGLELDRFFQDLNDESSLPVLLSKHLFANAEGTTDWFKWKITTIPFFPHTEESLRAMAAHRFMAAIEDAGVVACWKKNDDRDGYFTKENSELPFPCKGIEEVASTLVKQHVDPLRKRYQKLHGGVIDSEDGYANWVRYNARAVITQVERMIEDFLATKARLERRGERLGLRLASKKSPPELDFVIVESGTLRMLSNAGAEWPSPKDSHDKQPPLEDTGKNNSTAAHIKLDPSIGVDMQANHIEATGTASGV